MIKTAYAIAVSVIAASVFVAFPSLSPQVGASAPVVGAKGDRADIRPLGTECGERGPISIAHARAMRAFRSPSRAMFECFPRTALPIQLRFASARTVASHCGGRGFSLSSAENLFRASW